MSGSDLPGPAGEGAEEARAEAAEGGGEADSQAITNPDADRSADSPAELAQLKPQAEGLEASSASQESPATTTQTSAPEAAEPSSAPKGERLSTIDLFRGLTILEVVAHHATGLALRHLPEGTLVYALTEALNRTLHFAVPAFVFLSAVVLTRSLLRRFEPGRYVWRRLSRGGWPYLLWSVLYMLWYVWTGQRPPETLTDPDKWELYLLYGKASYHLYFLLVALEVYLILPLLLPLARRRPSITAMLLLGAAVQLGLYFLNREVLRLPFPASTALWYALPILLGMAVGARYQDFPEWWRGRRWKLLPLLALAYALYLPQALAYVRGQPVTPLLYTGLSWAFTALMALTLLGAAERLNRVGSTLGLWFRRMVGTLGTVSLQVYLIHPAILQTLERYAPPQGRASRVLLTIAAYIAVGVLVPAVLGRLLLRTPLSVPLFGR